MIVVSLFFVKQFRFMLNTDLGYQTTDIIKTQFLRASSYSIISDLDAYMKRVENENKIAGEIVQKMKASPLFTHWTYGQSPNTFSGGNWSFKIPEGEFKRINLVRTDATWFKIFDIQLKEGRLWDDETDDFRTYNVIVTESVLSHFGITDINNALLQPQSRIWITGSADRADEMRTNPPFRIVGVVNDFDYQHLSQKSEPVIFHYSTASRNAQLIASVVPGRTQEAVMFLKSLHEETVGGDFSYSFVEDEVHAMYREDKKIASIYSVFTFIAIFISVLGLLSMSLFDIQQRRKEIAIRKINGATFSDIIELLLKKYFWTMGVSFVIATPVALFTIHRYLEDFANKAPVSWWLFAVAILLTAGISLLTLLYQTRKAANQNPAETINN
jgi:ABC-type antimicrobial peptide transport system permease subunit